jgi:inorganic triphosphatase YgiF
MEIEAKFLLPNEVVFVKLRTLEQLGDFFLSSAQVRKVRDTYLDTVDRRILGGGYACRKRERSTGILYTLKSLAGGNGPVHRREELEVALPSERPPGEWPPGPARDKVLALIGSYPLEPLFHLQQERVIRAIHRHDREVAEFSLDRVCLVEGERTHAYLVLEVELVAQGTEQDLMDFVTFFQQRWDLPVEPRSKFEQALAFLGT